MAVAIQPTDIPLSSDSDINTAEDDNGDFAITLQSVQIRIGPVKLYKRRYAMLAMFGALGFLQCAVWNTWGPLSSVVKIAYPSFTADQIAWLALWAPLLCIFCTPIFMVLIQKCGLRLVMIISTFLMALGCFIRCLSTDPEYFVLTAHACAVLNGLAGIAVGIAPSLLSTLWFPISSRTTATGFGCTMNQLGNAGGFFMGPVLVHVPRAVFKAIRTAIDTFNEKMDVLGTTNCMAEDQCLSAEGKLERLPKHSLWSSLYPYGGQDYSVSPFQGLREGVEGTGCPEGPNVTLSVVSPEVQDYLRDGIYNYMVISAGLAIGLFILVVAYFEDEPPSPPVPLVSAAERRWTGSITSTRRSRVAQDISGTRSLTDIAKITASAFRNSSFVVMLFCYSITLGINVAWTSVLDVNLEPMGVTMTESSWIGVFITFGGVFLALVVSRISDTYMECHKIIIIILLFLSTIFYGLFVMAIKQCFPFNMWFLQISAVLGGSFNYAVSPLFFELFMELGHPAPEDVLGSVITIFWNIAGLVFLLVMESQTKCEPVTVSSLIWMDYLLLGQAALCCFLMLFVKQDYKRSAFIIQDRLQAAGHTVPPILEEENLSCTFVSDSEMCTDDSDLTPVESEDENIDIRGRFVLPSSLGRSYGTSGPLDDVRLLIDGDVSPQPISSSSSSDSIIAA